MVERVTRHLSERIGEHAIAAHHGSLAKEQRLDAERASRPASCARWWPPHRSSSASTSAMSSWCASSELRARSRLFCSASVAPIMPSAVCPRGGCCRLSRDELVECTALLDAVRAGELDAL
jgi:ATP-dependent Lhr-like helicase